MMTQGNQLPWTDQQWAAVQQTAQESARRARVASSFLPLVGPLSDHPTNVAAMRLDEVPAGQEGSGGLRTTIEPLKLRLEVEDSDTLRVTTVAVELFLKSAQIEDPDLTAVRQMVGRAADVIGRLEDAIVFNGQPGAGTAPTWEDSGPRMVQPDIYSVHGGQQNAGLIGSDARFIVNCDFEGDSLVRAVVHGVTMLEGQGHYGPFAVVLGSDLYLTANTPNAGSLVLPSDRIVPFLNGPLLRSAVIPANRGVVVSLAAAPVELVVAQDIRVSFLQVTLEPRWVVRVAERFVLRVRQEGAVISLVGAPAAAPA